ncbi:MAG: peptide transporter, partial [Thermoplasmata archaeon]
MLEILIYTKNVEKYLMCFVYSRSPVAMVVWSKVKRWIGDNRTALILIAIFVFAFTLRSLSAYWPSVSNSPIPGEFSVSGGSDSYYHRRIIDYMLSTHRSMSYQNTIDPLLNYPISARNPRPPFYHWFVVLSAYIISPFTHGDVYLASWYTFIFSTSLFGALTIFPLYLIGKTAFNRKVGLWAAFLLAISPGHIERSVLTNADHDAMAMFFIVTAAYFMLRALQVIKEKKYVSTWKSPRSIFEGFLMCMRENRESLHYASFAGLAVASAAFVWTGFIYIIVLFIMYFAVQTVINLFRKLDNFALGVLILFFGAFSYGPIVLYYDVGLHSMKWLSIPIIMVFSVALFVFISSVLRDWPWLLSLPMLGVLVLAVALSLKYLHPFVFEKIVSGMGYIIKSKLYTTIAEAQPPRFSRFALSFGPITFFMAFVGLGYAIYEYIKEPKPAMLFISMWALMSIYMAVSAARFVFNATPVFILMSAWVLVMVIDRLNYGEVIKKYRSVRGYGWSAIKKSFRVRHVLGALFIVFLIILPNAWYAVDASIPYEYKRDADLKIYEIMPRFMRPKNYDDVNGSIWYLGAFGYSLPIKKGRWYEVSYWSDAWEWLSKQDTDVSPEKRPAFLSWWDYGFECIQEGKHPTVADNFQYGYQFAGNAIAAQGEREAVALFCARLIEADFIKNKKRGLSDGVKDVLLHYLSDDDLKFIEDVLKTTVNKGRKYVDIVLNNPDKYGPRSADLYPINAMYTVLKVMFNEKLEGEKLTNFYHALIEKTGWSIRYFAIDSRLFPFPRRSGSIFYAPIKLSDHRIDKDGTPIDFYKIKIVTDMGEFDPDDVPQDAHVKGTRKVYTDMFYNTMLYKIYIGYRGKDIGATDGIPALSDNLRQYRTMPGWNMTHFRLAYKTMYWNPYEDYQNHTKDWYAVSYDEAIKLSKENKGVVLPEIASLYHGVVFLEYYEGAYFNGTVTTTAGYPAPHVLLTVFDEYDIPHDHTYTDANGRFSLLLPYGNLTIKIS